MLIVSYDWWSRPGWRWWREALVERFISIGKPSPLVPLANPAASTIRRQTSLYRFNHRVVAVLITIVGKAVTIPSAKMSSPEHAAHDEGGDDDIIREQDRLLPIANVARIMKQAVPSNAKIAKDAKETVQECVSEFISFITSEASDRCQQEKRKTINGEDIVWAMEALGFDQYGQLMKLYLQKYKEVTKVDKGHGDFGSSVYDSTNINGVPFQ